MNGHRGAVLVESAFAVSLLLLTIYGSVQLGMVGLEQLTVDGGAYTAAHQQAMLGANLKNYNDGPTVAKNALPHLKSGSVSIPVPSYGEPPTAEGPSTQQYNFNNPNARHGGVSMIQPVQTISTVTRQNIANLLVNAGNTLSVTGIAIDPAFRLINGHGNISGNGFNSAGAFSTASDPLVNGNNAPPYFIGFNYIKMCQPWTNCNASHFVGLGLAEYLDVNNWGRAVNGVVPDGLAVFWEARLHQNQYAQIATQLKAVGGNFNAAGTVLDPNAANGPTACVYSFDNDNLGSYAIGTVTIGSYPLNPGGSAAKCS